MDMTAAERLNNAIVRLDFVSGASGTVPRAIQSDVEKLARDWQSFWRGNFRALVPAPLTGPELRAYWSAYRGIWFRLPAAAKALVPSPQNIESLPAELWDDYVEKLKDAGQAVVPDMPKRGGWVIAGLGILGLWWLSRKVSA